jgi:copper(I)-binding protein
MLVGLAHPLAPGGDFPLTLRFEKAGDLTVRVRVAVRD